MAFNPMVLPLIFVVAIAGLFTGLFAPAGGATGAGLLGSMIALLIVTVAAFVAPPGPPALMVHLTQIFIIGLVIGNIPGLFIIA